MTKEEYDNLKKEDALYDAYLDKQPKDMDDLYLELDNILYECQKHITRYKIAVKNLNSLRKELQDFFNENYEYLYAESKLIKSVLDEIDRWDYE